LCEFGGAIFCRCLFGLGNMPKESRCFTSTEIPRIAPRAFAGLQVVSETESIYSVFSVKINPEARRSIWFGMSAEDQQRFNERAEYLTGIRLAENITFVSAEPLLGDIPRVFETELSGNKGGPSETLNPKEIIRNVGKLAKSDSMAPNSKPASSTGIDIEKIREPRF